MLAPLFFLACALAGTPDGPAMFRCSPTHEGVAPGPLRLPGELAWTVPTKGKVRSTPAVAGGQAYFGSDDGIFRAVELRDGREVWRFEAGCELPCSPAIAQGRVLFQGRDNVLRALDLRDGRLLWKHGMGSDLPRRKGDYLGWDYWVSSPTVVGETVFIGGGDGKVHAVDLATGRTRWAFATAQRVRSSPAVAKGKVIVGSSDEQFVHALDTKSGEECWKLPVRYRVLGSPVVAGDAVHFGTEGAYVFTVDLETGLVLGSCGGEGPVNASVVPTGELLLVPSDDQHLRAFRTEAPPPSTPADPALMAACTGRFALGRRTFFTLSVDQGRLRFERAGFPPRLAILGADGKLSVPADGLEGRATREGTGPAQITFHLGGKNVPATRLP